MLEKLPDAIGHALANQRAGLDAIVFNSVDLRAGKAAIEVTSLAFVDHAPMPPHYTADGEGLSPPLQWTGVPRSSASVLLIVEDADSPTPNPLVHAIVVELPTEQAALGEGAIDSTDHVGAGLKTGRNSLLQTAWLPPDPPPGHGVHRYAFQVFALAAPEDGKRWSEAPGRDEVMEAIRLRGLASGCLIGTYERPDGSVKDEASEPAAAGVPIGVQAAGI